MLLALFWSRRLGAPISELHRGAVAVSRGDLDHRIVIEGEDELADLAEAFNQMTATLKDNQARLAARMKEIVALHDAGRAVSSVIDLDQVSRKIVDAVARTFDVRLAALWLVEGGAKPGLRASAARARRPEVTSALATEEALAAAEGLRAVADRVRESRVGVRLVHAGDDPDLGAAARAAGVPGPLVALPLERKNRIVGVLAVARAQDAREFSDADLNLLTTFADQAGAAVENAQLYQEVRGASEELEKKVRLRTAELTAINTELGRALADLRETQAQLVLAIRNWRRQEQYTLLKSFRDKTINKPQTDFHCHLREHGSKKKNSQRTQEDPCPNHRDLLDITDKTRSVCHFGKLGQIDKDKCQHHHPVEDAFHDDRRQ